MYIYIHIYIYIYIYIERERERERERDTYIGNNCHRRSRTDYPWGAASRVRSELRL